MCLLLDIDQNGKTGRLGYDFRINHLGAVTAVRNAPSPAATASLAIAEHIGDEVVAAIGRGTR